MILEPSKYLVKVKIKGDKKSYIIYHSLFGNATYVKQPMVDLIRFFSSGKELNTLFKKKGFLKHQRRVAELRKLHFLVEKNSDERAIIRGSFTDKIRAALVYGKLIHSIRFEMASYCNFRCQHCYARQIYRWGPKHYMGFKTAKKAMDGFFSLLHNSGRNKALVTFWGGEPLLNWGTIKKIVEYSNIKAKNFSIKLDFGLITNASLLNDDMLAFMKKFSFRVAVSLDGLKKDNDRFRKFLNGKGTFDSIIKGLDGLKKYGIRFTVELCLNDYNFDSIEKVIDFLKYKYDDPGLTITTIHSPYQEVYFDTHSAKEKAERMIQIFDYALKKRSKVSIFGFDLIENAIRRGKRSPFACGLSETLYVKPSGMVYPCWKVSKAIDKIGKIKNIANNRTYQLTAIRTTGNLKGCLGCEIEGICRGGCAGITQFYSGDISNTGHHLFQKNYCDYRRYLFQGILQRMAKQIPHG